MTNSHLGPPAVVARIAIDQKYNQLGGATGKLGQATSELNYSAQEGSPSGPGYFRDYERGSIYWSHDTGAHEIEGDIRDKWKHLGAEHYFLGYPLTDETPTPPPNTVGRYNHFQGGSIYWHPDLGAWEVHGDIRGQWASLGWELSFLGFPKTDETKTPDGQGRYNHFQGGSIYWHPDLGAWEVHGDIRERWASLGWEQSYLGYPISNETPLIDPQTNQGGRISYFQYGYIQWFPQTGAIDVPETRTFNNNSMTFADNTTVNGYAWLVIQANGNFRYSLHAHNSGGLPYNTVTFAIVGSGRADNDSLQTDGAMFGVKHAGTVHGLEPGSRNSDASGEGTSALLGELWPFFRNGTFYPEITAANTIGAAFIDLRNAIQNALFGDDGHRTDGSTGVREDIRDV